MVTRTYPIRVGGKSGDLPNEIGPEVISARSGVSLDEIRRTEIGTVSGKPRRIGEFNIEQVRRSAVLNGATDIALTFADYLNNANRQARTSDQLTPETRTLIDEIEAITGVDVSLVATGPDNVIWRKPWQ
jgi:adenylosuccinate synthase